MTDTVKTADGVEPLVEQERSSALWTVIVLCFSGMSVSLMQTLVIPIQTELPDFLHTTAANASWVVTATLLGAAVAMPIAGRLGDLFGKRRVFFSGLALVSFVARTASVVAAQQRQATRPSASPIHWFGPAAGLVKPSTNAQATPAKPATRPKICEGRSASLFAMNGMPIATTNGAR